jgi:hypothetical protein
LEKFLSNHEAQNKGGHIYSPIVVFLLTAYQLLTLMSVNFLTRYHKYARVGVKVAKRNRILI